MNWKQLQFTLSQTHPLHPLFGEHVVHIARMVHGDHFLARGVEGHRVQRDVARNVGDVNEKAVFAVFCQFPVNMFLNMSFLFFD